MRRKLLTGWGPRRTTLDPGCSRRQHPRMDDITRLEEFKKMLAVPASAPAGVKKRACLCGKLLTESEHTVRCHSGVVNFEECLCSDCRKEMKDFVRVVCLKCRTLMSLLKPQRATTGFTFTPRSCVHVEKCQTCAPGLTSVPVLEHLRFCRAQGRPTNVDADIVQEAEQKTLQAVSEAGKMRTELKDSFAAP